MLTADKLVLPGSKTSRWCIAFVDYFPKIISRPAHLPRLFLRMVTIAGLAQINRRRLPALGSSRMTIRGTVLIFRSGRWPSCFGRRPSVAGKNRHPLRVVTFERALQLADAVLAEKAQPDHRRQRASQTTMP
jgi:hypothetical protein